MTEEELRQLAGGGYQPQNSPQNRFPQQQQPQMNMQAPQMNQQAPQPKDFMVGNGMPANFRNPLFDDGIRGDPNKVQGTAASAPQQEAPLMGQMAQAWQMRRDAKAAGQTPEERMPNIPQGEFTQGSGWSGGPAGLTPKQQVMYGALPEQYKQDISNFEGSDHQTAQRRQYKDALHAFREGSRTDTGGSSAYRAWEDGVKDSVGDKGGTSMKPYIAALRAS
jgi:hypothetical protein